MNKLTKETFIIKAHRKHNHRYDYSKVEYKGSKTKVCIICPTHGEFWQQPNNHLYGNGCPKCRYDRISENFRMTLDDFISKAKQKHGDKYDYSNVDYVNAKTKVQIKCYKHGIFQQIPYAHLCGQGCPKCVGKNITQDEFVKRGNIIHHNKYKYGLYDGYDKVMEIFCGKHGLFKQKPKYHLRGHGCPKCYTSRLEEEIRIVLGNYNVNFIEQYKSKWLGLQSLDFYLPDHNVAIECQGKQHFINGCSFGGCETLDAIQSRDKLKLQKCHENGVKLLYYSNLGIDYPYEVFEDKEDLIKSIFGVI